MVFDLENPRHYLPLTILIWITVTSSLEVLVFDGNAMSALVPGVAGGTAFGIAMYVLRDRDRDQ